MKEHSMPAPQTKCETGSVSADADAISGRTDSVVCDTSDIRTLMRAPSTSADRLDSELPTKVVTNADRRRTGSGCGPVSGPLFRGRTVEFGSPLLKGSRCGE